VFCFYITRRRNKKNTAHSHGKSKGLPFAEELHPGNYYEPIETDEKPHGANLIYHEPWGAGQGIDVTNRAKQKDLAYATSEEIRVLIEKMEKDRNSIIEGDEFPTPDPTYYRHVSTFKYNGHNNKDKTDGNLKDKKESETESVASENCGTEKLESEDSKVEADRCIDSDNDSHNGEPDSVSNYFDGYESPRVSSSHPSDVSTVRSTSVQSDTKSELPNYVYEEDDVILDDIEIPDEPAPPIGLAILNQLKEKRKSGDLAEGVEGKIILGAYRDPQAGNDNRTREGTSEADDKSDSKSDAPYSPVYDEIADQQTKL